MEAARNILATIQPCSVRAVAYQSTVHYYCTACETEWTRRWRAEVEKKTAARRAGRLRRKARALGVRRCCICRGPIPSEKRTDILHCSAKCRQVAYRERRRRAKTSACR
jgi:predicted nucleic acid-binding Zn ribbon protein